MLILAGEGPLGGKRKALLDQIRTVDKPIPFAPDLAVEVASPSQNSDDMAAKARLYLRAGTRMVWIVWPQSTHIDLWHADVLTGPVLTQRKGDILSGEDVVPGFSYPIADLFAVPLRPERRG